MKSKTPFFGKIILALLSRLQLHEAHNSLPCVLVYNSAYKEQGTLSNIHKEVKEEDLVLVSIQTDQTAVQAYSLPCVLAELYIKELAARLKQSGKYQFEV
jgi:hypothetical protein